MVTVKSECLLGAFSHEAGNPCCKVIIQQCCWICEFRFFATSNVFFFFMRKRKKESLEEILFFCGLSWKKKWLQKNMFPFKWFVCTFIFCTQNQFYNLYSVLTWCWRTSRNALCLSYTNLSATNCFSKTWCLSS